MAKPCPSLSWEEGVVERSISMRSGKLARRILAVLVVGAMLGPARSSGATTPYGDADVSINPVASPIQQILNRWDAYELGVVLTLRSRDARPARGTRQG